MSTTPAAEDARDSALAEVGYVILGLQDGGSSDAEIIDAVVAMIELRMRLRRIDPVAALTATEEM